VITTCSKCGGAYDALSEESANEPERYCPICWYELWREGTIAKDINRRSVHRVGQGGLLINPHPLGSVARRRWSEGYEVGFTLVELLVVMAIISILAALYLSSLPSVMMRGKIARCQSNQRQLVMGISMYVGETGVYPIPVTQTAPVVGWPTLCGLPWNVRGDSIARCPDAGAWSESYNWLGSWLPSAHPSIYCLSQGLGQVLPGPAVKESAVAFPAQMMAVCDGASIFWSTWPGARHHNGTQNLAFCDGHGELFSRGRLMRTNDLTRVWNLDNQPHQELWQ